tara:strand:- start:4357 stop:5043 length:687 start_codon:yes stop_codon:yes gene_type:complete
MLQFFIDIYDILIELYQQFFGVPEGISYALFGSRKRKKAKRALNKAQGEIDQKLDSNLNSIPTDESNSNVESTEFVGGEAKVGEDVPDVPFIPSFPYTGRQIILNSGRVHLNAADDFVLINSKKSISLAAPGSVNLDTEGAFIVNAEKIKLGIGDKSNHPIAKGDAVEATFFSITQQLSDASASLANATDSSGGEITACKAVAQNFRVIIQQVNQNLERISSTKNFTQ